MRQSLLAPAVVVALSGILYGCAAAPERPAVVRPDVSGSGSGDVKAAPDGTQASDEGVVSLDVGPGATDIDEPIEPGAFGWPCQANDECLSGWCVEGAAGGGVCTQPCFDQCPDGWACRPIGNLGGEVTYICVFRTARLCWPCRADSDCRSATTDPDARCVDRGDSGRFCGVSCLDDSTCPDGYACQDQGAGGRQCVPAQGECACGERATSLALETDCAVTTSYGKCLGERGCTASGLSACTASTPVEEVCNGVDDDCDGLTDAGDAVDCVRYYPDEDGDDYGIGAGVCECAAPGPNYVVAGGDCSDGDANVSPGVTESCNFIDDDCDGQTDEPGSSGCTHYYPDVDKDGYGDPAGDRCECSPPGEGYITVGGDCADNDPNLGPGDPEKCDGIDNDCDGQTDEDNAKGCKVYYADKDGDGYGKTTELRCGCAPDAGHTVDRGGDCNDQDAKIKPLAPEVCNFIDDNCDGVADEAGTIGCGPFMKDADADGYGDSGDVKCFCQATFPYTATVGGDCNDIATNVNPKGNEVCDGVDNDCDGEIDGWTANNCQYFYRDYDQDGFGDEATKQCMCEPKTPWNTLNGGDCNDQNPLAFPGATEVCGGGDENCNGLSNENGAVGCYNFYRDNDGDGFGTSEFQCVCQPENGFTVLISGDCYDQNADARPGQNVWMVLHRGDGSFDYNCDGNEERESTTEGGHCDTTLGFCDSTQIGFRGGIPGCGVYGDWLYDCDSGFFSCDDVITAKQQRCR